ncbi:MAG: Chromosome partition protein Smc [Ignavibacteria bacterium]|nr:Chromosome partition protein Smc [Ignavibacteria bacterium]
MYLSKLEIFGFKSFAEKTTIEFDSGVCAIVGPNGSGKSNIVDALRWVLGEQGDKALRSGKREDVVFNGTKFRKPLSIAEVAVTIQNDSGKLPTEFREVQIARRFFRSGDTEYYLNGTRVRLKDIKELFIDTGIGPDAYSVIELKMVETILSDIKHERRKLFEEAAGVVSYKHNRDLTFNRLESVHETLLRVNDIIREKQRNVNALERQAKRNEEAKLVSEELKSLELKTGKYEFKMLLSEISDIKSKEGDNLTLKASLSEEMNSNDVKLDLLRNELKQLEDNLNIQNEKLGILKDKINRKEKDNLVIGEKLSNLNDNILRLKNENETSEAGMNRNLEKKESTENRIKVLGDTILISGNSLNEKKSKLDATIKVINEKKSELMELGIKLKEINKQVTEKKSLYQENKLNFENNLQQLEKLSGQNAGFILQIEELMKEKNDLEILQKDTDDLLRHKSRFLKEKEDEAEFLSKQISGIAKELSDKKLELNGILSKIEHLNNLTENLDDFAEGVKFLVKDVKEKNVNTVLDLLEVEDKFKIAIETALGEISNYLIVDNYNNADRLIDLLKENEKGKVTFIINDLLNYKSQELFYLISDEPEFIGKTGVYGFADKFVKCKDEKYQRLIKYILDEFVIVDNLKTAKKFAEDNYYKFITLDGDIYTGGFIRAGGAINLETVKLGRQQKIDSLNEEAEIVKGNIAKLESESENLMSKQTEILIDEYKAEYENLKSEFDKTSNEVSKIDFKIEQINNSITANEDSYKSVSETNKILSGKINILIEEVNKSENEQYNLDKELIFLTNEFNEIEKEFSAESADYNNFNIEFLKVKNEHKNDENNLQSIISAVSFAKNRINSNTKTIQENESSIKMLNDVMKENDVELAELKSGLDESESGIDKLKNETEIKRNEQHDTDLRQRQVRIDFDGISQKLINAQIKIKENEIKSEQIKDYLYKKYEKDISYDSGNLKEEFADFDFIASKNQIDELNEKLKRLGGGYQQILFEDFENEKAELQKLIEQKEDLIESEKDIRKTIDRINKEARERFLNTFEKIRENFISIFKELFSEGDEANLRIVYDEDEEGNVNEDPLEAKIEIIAKPRGKRPTSIELLSGGEKTLTAIALLFAIYLVKPSPFCVLDEVDAPLDVANLGRFNKMIRKFSENTQFILITHNERTMETVDRLYGVTMQESGVTTIVETKFKSDEKLQA